MKLPTQIVTRHKIRDAKICRLYATDNLSMEDIALRFGISSTRIYQIIYKNRHLLKIDIDWEKQKQVSRIKRQIAKKKDSKKDVADLEELLRKILDGDKPIIQTTISIHNFKEFVNNAYRNNGEAIKLRDGKEDTSRLPG